MIRTQATEGCQGTAPTWPVSSATRFGTENICPTAASITRLGAA